MNPDDFEEARNLVQRLFEMTNPNNPEADEAANLLDGFIDQVQWEILPPSDDGFATRMERLRSRFDRIRRKVRNAPSKEENFRTD